RQQIREADERRRQLTGAQAEPLREPVEPCEVRVVEDGDETRGAAEARPDRREQALDVGGVIERAVEQDRGAPVAFTREIGQRLAGGEQRLARALDEAEEAA